MKYDFNIDMLSDNSLSLILREIQPKTTVLEFGPAKGYMTAYLKHELGCKVIGVEIDAEAAKIAEVFVEKMIVCDAESLVWMKEIPTGTLFDHIVFADVLEHLRNPVAVLREASSFLKPGGTILTSIPNIGHSAVIMELLHGKFEYRPLGLLDNTHIRFFTRESVKQLIKDAGLQPIKWKSANILPEHTELQRDYSSVPQEIGNYLKKNKDAHVYQFITVSGKVSEEVSETEEQDNNSYILAEYAQLFWAKDKNYTEESSLKIPVNSNDFGFNTYDFKIEGPSLKYPLRLDPTNFKSIIEIDHITLLNQQGSIIKFWTNTEIADCVQILHGAESIQLYNKYILYANGNDPQLLFNFELEGTVEEYQLSVNMSIKKEVQEEYSNLVTHIGDLTNDNRLNKNELLNLQDEYKVLTIFSNELVSREKELQFQLTHKEEAINQFQSNIKLLNQQLKESQEMIHQLLNSRSWKLTKPFRWIKDVLRGVAGRK
ncbi:bifunctional 2-polyprenyl-6-hydroxyphenol methylase/3-demethylubiquinol 3-O-methyltransferase UbiG [Bacillus sp. FJAT-26390]|uniref:class I SAM-dependent methyltransferase n=1 Tax=Bacillus sp. FJAT-26390 TaxID=1743142 RepID=UPI000807FD01|nr:class I SAM-dependent methyltransferase [Bacillus sp. FJAT-26390]OBZ13451.1 hypothetical protein A7975_11505 [Bacillus sp. FJAT-26390]